MVRVETVTLADGTMEHYSYDHAGNVCAATDGNGNTVRYVYNRANQLAERQDAAGCIEKFTYDILGRLQGHCDRDGRQVHYAYNMFGSPTRSAAEGNTWQITAMMPWDGCPLHLEAACAMITGTMLKAD